MSDAKPVKCQKCGRPMGFLTVLSKGFFGLQQLLPKVKLVGICIESFHKKES